MTSHYINFSNQDNRTLTLDYKGSNPKGTTFEKGDGSFISGEDGNFTVYFNTVGETDDIYTKTALVISGTKTSSGIRDLKYAFVMVEKGPDPNHELMEEGIFRVFKDSDGLAVNATFNFNFNAPKKADGMNGFSLFHYYIKSL